MDWVYAITFAKGATVYTRSSDINVIWAIVRQGYADGNGDLISVKRNPLLDAVVSDYATMT